MKTNESTKDVTNTNPTLAKVCLDSGRKLVAQLARIRDSIMAEFRDSMKAHEQLLRLALNEAEALAWETGYPELIFPTLAREKAQAVATWEAHQGAIRRGNSRP
jgi:hypothetical protein